MSGLTHYTRPRRNSIPPKNISGLQITRQRRSKLERARLGASVKRKDTELGALTDVQLAKILGISPQFLGKIAREEAAVRDPVIVQIAAE
jgi:hypothetical protein